MSSRETSVEPSSSDMRKIVQFNEYLLLDENSIQLSLGIGMQPEYESKKLKAIDDDLLLRLKDIIMYEILTRVPLDSLMQWMCVCKEWSSLIISPSFGSMHSRRNTSKNPGLIFYSTRDATRDVNRDDFDYYEGTPHLVFFDINKKVERAIQLPPEIEDDCRGKVVTVLHSLNGLVLISCSSHDMSSKMVSDYVLNPITGYYTTLPVPDMDDMETGYGKDNYLILVYDSVASKYKAAAFLGEMLLYQSPGGIYVEKIHQLLRMVIYIVCLVVSGIFVI